MRFALGVFVMDRVTRSAELDVLLALREAVGLKALGCYFDRGLSGSVCVRLRNEPVGAWWFEDGVYKFSYTASRVPEYQTDDLGQLVEKTVSMVVALGNRLDRQTVALKDLRSISSLLDSRKFDA